MSGEPADVEHAEERDRHALDLPRPRGAPQRQAEHQQEERSGQESALAAVRVQGRPQDAEARQDPETHVRLEPLAAHHAIELGEPERDLERHEPRESEAACARQQDEERHEDQAARNSPAQRPARRLGRSGRGFGSGGLLGRPHARGFPRRAQSTRPNRRSRRW